MSSRVVMPLFLIVLLWLAGLGSAAQFAKISVIFTELQTHYDQFGPASGFLLSLISFLGIVFGMFAGIVGAHIGFRRLFIAGLIFSALLSLFQATLPPFWLMLASRLLEGATHLAIVVAAPTLIAEIAPQRYQGFALTLWGTFFGVAFAIMAFLMPSLVALGGLPAVFIAHGVYMAVFAIILMVLLPKTYGRKTEDGPWPSLGDIIARHRQAYRSPFISAPALGWVFYAATFVALLTVLPTFGPEDNKAFMLATLPIVSIIASMTIGLWLLRHASATVVVMIGFGLSIPLGCLLWLMPDSVPLAIALFASMGLVQGATFAAVAELNPKTEDRALANGGLAQMGNLGNLLGTPVLLAAIGIFDAWGLTLFAVTCFGLALAAHIWLARVRSNLPPP